MHEEQHWKKYEVSFPENGVTSFREKGFYTFSQKDDLT